MTEGITTEDRKTLLRPFTPEAVKFRIDGKPFGGRVRILTYIDSRLAAERLSDVDPNWHGYPMFPGSNEVDPIGLNQGLPVSYRLSVKGATRTDVGQLGPISWGERKGQYVADDKHVKMAVSDALKRSAVLFGVGAYLYTLGNVSVDTKLHTTKGEGKYINNKGMEFLRDQYRKHISSRAFIERFGEAVDYGDSIASDSGITDPVDDSVADTKENTPEDVPVVADNTKQGVAPLGTLGVDPLSNVVAGLFDLLGKSSEAGTIWLSGRKNKTLAVKKTLRQSAEKGADESKVKNLLESNGLGDDYLNAFLSASKEGATA